MEWIRTDPPAHFVRADVYPAPFDANVSVIRGGVQ